MRRLKDNNSGLSLIEVLVAMIILSIVVTPFLHSFFSTATANAKAKKMHKATIVAQSVMEGIRAESVESIAKQFNYPGANWRITSPSIINGGASLSAHVAELSYDPTTNSYGAVMRYEDVPSGSIDRRSLVTSSAYSEDGGTTVEFLPNASGVYYYAVDTLKEDKSTYDVLVKLDATPTTTGATSYNSQPLVQLPVLDEEKDAICIEKLSYLDNALAACAVGDVTGLSRKITISVDRTHFAGGGGDRTRVKVTYKYSKIGDSSKNFTKEVTCYDSIETGEELRTIYLYYSPIYPADQQYDQIEYISNSNIPVNLYIMKQKYETPTSGLPQTTSALEEGYKMELSLYSSAVVNWADCNTVLYTNLNQNMMNDNNPIAVGQYRVTFNGVSIDIGSNRLTSSSSENRVFDMTVSVYEAGARAENFPASKLLTTIDSNKLN